MDDDSIGHFECTLLHGRLRPLNVTKFSDNLVRDPDDFLVVRVSSDHAAFLVCCDKGR